MQKLWTKSNRQSLLDMRLPHWVANRSEHPIVNFSWRLDCYETYFDRSQLSMAEKIKIEDPQRCGDEKNEWLPVALMRGGVTWRLDANGRVDFQLTRTMTNHRFSSLILTWNGKRSSDKFSSLQCDDAEHTLFSCPAWNAKRSMVNGSLSHCPDVRSPSNNVVGDELHWGAIAYCCWVVLLAKEEVERSREINGRNFLISVLVYKY